MRHGAYWRKYGVQQVTQWSKKPDVDRIKEELQTPITYMLLSGASRRQFVSPVFLENLLYLKFTYNTLNLFIIPYLLHHLQSKSDFFRELLRIHKKLSVIEFILVRLDCTPATQLEKTVSWVISCDFLKIFHLAIPKKTREWLLLL